MNARHEPERSRRPKFARARDVAAGRLDQVRSFGAALGAHVHLPAGSETTIHGADRLDKALLQYLETHDHERFICSFGIHQNEESLLREGERDQWPRLQPYLIGLLCARGAPMLWQGQELVESYFVLDLLPQHPDAPKCRHPLPSNYGRIWSRVTQ